MVQRVLVLTLLSTIVIGGLTSFHPTQSASVEPCTQDHEAWLGHILDKMEAVKPGMTRTDLLKVFTEKDGPRTGLRGTFVSRDYPRFRVDVEFKTLNQFYGFSMTPEDYTDIIVKVSKPYLQSAFRD